ncbi:phosphoglycolate phosphatase [Metabacillus crassostreae]|uniref:HAD-IA family hydrolase n=1 Tax=Metabacillus crassostreae TaxID=929098 RepID=UPI0030844FBE|nr:phosphoglycolate phosphatase [Metabacillus crassostreae]
MTIRYVVFDFDGTLADTSEAFMYAWNKLADKYRYKKIKLEQIETIKKLNMKERSALLNFPLYKIPFVMPELIKLYKDSIVDITLFPGVKSLLEKLKKKGYKIAIISSNSEENIKNALKRNHADHLITDVISAKRIFGKDKTIDQFLKIKKLQASEMIYIGDEIRDIIACKKSNVKIVWVEWGYDGLEVIKSAEPDYMVKEPDEILEIVKK